MDIDPIAWAKLQVELEEARATIKALEGAEQSRLNGIHRLHMEMIAKADPDGQTRLYCPLCGQQRGRPYVESAAQAARTRAAKKQKLAEEDAELLRWWKGQQPPPTGPSP